MAARNDTPPFNPRSPTVEIDIRTLVSAAAAERQEAALAHLREGVRLIKKLLDLPEVVGSHRGQLEYTLPPLDEVIEYLGPVEIFAADPTEKLS